jgi:hypothetical protein
MLDHPGKPGDGGPSGSIRERIGMDDPGCRLAHYRLDHRPFSPECMDEFYDLNGSDAPRDAYYNLFSGERLHLCHAITIS